MSSKADQVTASLEDSNHRCQKLTDELDVFSCVDKQSKSELARATKEIETLTSQVIQFENDSQSAKQEAVNSANVADRLLEENTKLKSSLAKLEDQCAVADAEAKDLLKLKENVEARLQEEIEHRARATTEFDSEIAERESRLAASEQEVVRLQSETAALAEDAKLKLAEALSNLSHEQVLHSQLKEVADREREELSLQASKIVEQEARFESLEKAAKKANDDLAGTLELLECEKASLAAVHENAQKQQEEIGDLVSRCSDLQSSLSTSEQRAEQAERETAKTLELLVKEQELGAEVVQKLEDSEKRVDELEHEADAPTVAVADYHRLGSKLIKYKNAYEKIKDLAEGLDVQKKEMSDLASEYLAMTRAIRHELDEERLTSRELKTKLDKANASAVDFNEAELKRLVDERARDFVLDLKSQFEEKIKQKNELIREIRESQVVESSVR